MWISLALNIFEADVSLSLWRPHTRSITSVTGVRHRARLSEHSGLREHISFTAPAKGSYYIQVHISSPGNLGYRLNYVKRVPARTQRT